MATTPEGKIKAKLDAMLKSFAPDVWYFSPQAGPYGAAGIPDRIICARGYFLAAECKPDITKEPTALQSRCINLIRNAGGRAYLVRSVEDIDKLREVISLIQRNAGSILC